jgi:hypothetical protein
MYVRKPELAEAPAHHGAVACAVISGQPNQSPPIVLWLKLLAFRGFQPEVAAAQQ